MLCLDIRIVFFYNKLFAFFSCRCPKSPNSVHELRISRGPHCGPNDLVLLILMYFQIIKKQIEPNSNLFIFSNFQLQHEF